MVLSPIIRSWSQRLAALESLERTLPPEEVWLIRIRIKILRFLLERHGVLLPPERESFQAPAPPPPPSAELRLETPRMYRGVRVEHPPKPRATIGRTLRDIQLVNRGVRSDCDRGDPEDAWRWWSDYWC